MADAPINLTNVETNGKLLLNAVYSVQQAILSSFPRVYGSFTLSAAATTTVANSSVVAGSIIIPFPTNAAAAGLMGSAKCLYQDTSLNVVGTSFSVKTGDGVAAAGTETFNYIMINPA
jgi:hypothetical protein